MTMDFGKTNELAIKKINKELKKLLLGWRKEIEKIDSTLLPLVDKFIKGCEGGKRLRGLLVVLGYEIGKRSSVISRQMSDKKQKESLTADSEASLKTDSSVIQIAAAYEIFHTAILAHDDVIDQSPKRRGQSSLYKAIGKDHYGITQAISLGDAGFFLATRIIAESNFPDEAKIKAISLFSRIMLDTAAGEMLDVERGDAITIMKLKTAKYSISGPLQLGSILSGKGEKLMNNLEKFGENLGIAFQIQDDILGIFGSEDITGKSTVSDIEEGKNTLLYVKAFQNADKKGRETLRKLYGRGKIHRQEAKAVRQLFKDAGALDFAKTKVAAYTDRAMKVLPLLTKDKKMGQLLGQMVEDLVQRTK